LSRNATLLKGLALAALTLLGAYVLLIAAMFSLIALYDTSSPNQFVGKLFIVVTLLVFAGLDFLLARKTFRVLKSWREQA